MSHSSKMNAGSPLFNRKKTVVEATTIDDIAKDYAFTPKIIKIDVEGGEYNVLKGRLRLLQQHNPVIVMEHLEAGRHNEKHQQAVNLMRQTGYKSYIITADGSLEEIVDINAYLTGNKMESDNIIFRK